MSIYQTLWEIKLLDAITERGILITVQAVPGHIKEPYPWLPPPVERDDELRAVLFISENDGKGLPGFHPQQYSAPLLVLSGKEYDSLSFQQVLEKLEDAIFQKLGVVL